MLKKLRYVTVAALAMSVVLAVLIVTGCVSGNEKNEVTEEAYEASTEPEIEVETEETEEPSSEIEITEESSSSEESTEEETEEEVEEKVGLDSYFQGKLILDPEKVDLYLNVREEPNEDAKILSVMFPNDILPYIGEEDGWYEVQCDGYTGFVHADLVCKDSEAYEELKHNVGYAVMAKEDEIILYAEPDESTTPIQVALKGDAYRVLSQYGNFYEVSVVSPVYSTLFVPKHDVMLYYLFLGPGNTNELSEENETYLHSLNIGDNIARAEKLQKEAEEEREAYEIALKEYEAELKKMEEKDKAAKQASIDAEMQAALASQQAEKQEVQPQQQPQQTSDGSARSLGVFRVTSYCHCQICCGVWGSNDPNYVAHGASGMQLIDNQSVAVDPSVIPLGSRIMINGKIYVAADTGVSGKIIDIYRQTHEAALSLGGEYPAEVFILP